VRYLGQSRRAKQTQAFDGFVEGQPLLIALEAITPTAHFEQLAGPLNSRIQERDRIAGFLQEQLISKFNNPIGGGNDFHLDVADHSRAIAAVSEDNPSLGLANLLQQNVIDVMGFGTGDEGPEGAADNRLVGKVGCIIFQGKTQPGLIEINNDIVAINGVDGEGWFDLIHVFYTRIVC